MCIAFQKLSFFAHRPGCAPGQCWWVQLSYFLRYLHGLADHCKLSALQFIWSPSMWFTCILLVLPPSTNARATNWRNVIIRVLPSFDRLTISWPPLCTRDLSSLPGISYDPPPLPLTVRGSERTFPWSLTTYEFA